MPLHPGILDFTSISRAVEIESKLLNQSDSEREQDRPFTERGKGRIGKRMSDVGIFPASARRDINMPVLDREKEHKEDAWESTNQDDDGINSNEFLTKVTICKQKQKQIIETLTFWNDI